MMFNDGPYDPPVFPGGPPHGRKPIHEAATFINEYRRDQVVSSTCDHSELAHAVTLSQDHTGVTVLLANLFDRAIDLTVQVTLPLDMQDASYCMWVFQLDENGVSRKRETSASRRLSRSDDLVVSLLLSPQTIYAVDFPRIDMLGDLDCDDDVDINDLIIFADCIAGPDVTTPSPGCDPNDFGNADLNGNANVDLADFAIFQKQFTGPR